MDWCSYSGAMVQSEIMCLVQGFSPNQPILPSNNKKNIFNVLRRKSSSPQLCLTPTTPDGDQSSVPSTPCSEKDRLDMMPSGRVSGGDNTEVVMATPSKARQKKFHRHFKSIPQDEKVLNYYSCALVADILLQGHLYISKNYFAFYSNVFGYVTKLLIPTSSVKKVSKEKTAYIIPNAVGITTDDEKHVFGSLLSRDSTYKLMVQVWETATIIVPSPIHEALIEKVVENADVVEIKENDCQVVTLSAINDEESSMSGSETNLEAKLIVRTTNLDTKSKSTAKINVDTKSYHDVFSQTMPTKTCAPFCNFWNSVTTPTVAVAISVVVLSILFISAFVLLVRIQKLQDSSFNYFNTRSVSEVQEYLDTNLAQISKVRQSLEALSTLIEGSESGLSRTSRWNSFSTNPNENYHHSS